MITGLVTRPILGCTLRKKPGNFMTPVRLMGDSKGLFLPDPPTHDGAVFKYVALGHAEAIEGGTFRIGTLHTYGDIEVRRADAFEGVHEINTGNLNVQGVAGVDFEAGAFERIGMRFRPGTHTGLRMQGNRIISRCANMYSLCFATSPDYPDDPGNQQAVFAIRDLEELIWRLSERHKVLRDFCIGRVTYRDRKTVFGDGLPDIPDPFVKPSVFSWEEEVRAIWNPPNWSDSLSPFISDPVDTSGIVERVR